MNRVKKVLGIGLAAGVMMMSAGTADAADVTVGSDLASSYVWRGITLNKDAVVQPWVDIAHPSGVALNIWANFDLGDDDGTFEKREFSEVDFDVSYTHDFELASVTVGYIEYVYPNQIWSIEVVEDEAVVERATADREAYVHVGGEPVPGLGVAVTVYQDLSNSEGTYAVLSGSYGHDVIEGFSLALNGSVAYTARGALNEPLKSGWHDYKVGVAADMAVMEDVAVHAFVNYVGTLDSDVLPSAAVREDVYGGIGVYHMF